MEMVMIKDAAKNLGVESHVLRYWEEELGLEIKRNSMGHRYYDDRDIRMFQEVKDLRDRGFSLKDIKEGIEKQKEKLKEEHLEEQATTAQKSNSENNKGNNKEPLLEITKIEAIENRAVKPEEELEQLKIVDFKTAQMQNLMNKIVANALRENKDIITSSIKSELTTDVMKQFDTVMREKEEKEEERYRKLDETLRLLQRSNDEVAATRTSRGLFGKNKRFKKD